MIFDKKQNQVHNSESVNQAGRDQNFHGITFEQHTASVKAALEDQKKLLERAHEAEYRLGTHELRIKIEELERQLRDPKAAYIAYQQRISLLERLLEEATENIGENRIRDALAALESGDDRKADEIFAEVVAHEEEEEQKSRERRSQAEYGRGLIAEVDIRWRDAARHYAKAANLVPTLNHLFKASEYASRSNDFIAAETFAAQAIEVARKGEDQNNIARALNLHAVVLSDKNDFDEAERLYREAISIHAKTVGTRHPEYVKQLGDLASVLSAKGELDEAERLYRNAIAIFDEKLGPDHLDTQRARSNLAALHDTP